MPFLFLSPSTQAGNPYVTEGNERLWMNRIADRMEPYLRASGINVTRNDPEGTVGTSIRASNAGNYDFHLALHSNAAPRMAKILADNLREIYPLPQRVRPLASTSITEIRRVRAPSVLAELGYHDNRADAEWIENNLEAIARSLTLSVTEYFGVPFLSPRPEREGVVSVESGNLLLRGAPATTARILARMPNGAPVRILNSYDDWSVVDYDGLLAVPKNKTAFPLCLKLRHGGISVYCAEKAGIL